MDKITCCDDDSDQFDRIEDSSKLLKAISDVTRIKILCVLSKEEICVCDLAERLGIAQNLLSHHLKVMESVGLLEKKRDGNQIFYSISEEQKIRVNDLKRFIGLS